MLDEYFRVQVTVPDDEATQQIGHDVGATLAAGDPRALGARPAAPFWLASENDSPEALVVPLRLRGTPAGYLVLGGPGDVTDLDRQVAERAARVLGIELAKQRAVTEAQLRLQGDFLDDLLSGELPERGGDAGPRPLDGPRPRPAARAAGGEPGGAGSTGSQVRSASRRPTWSGPRSCGSPRAPCFESARIASPWRCHAPSPPTSEEALELAERCARGSPRC